ncbi:uncharacterized protein DSM5745_06797 [Aspergillus mulundensis]|uniref:Uncharacterized protein n=1 Tax=Aspergillus mulundensis TaxID=1810919 RepID=A0A3D8RS19_9EURO|nr:hypothetical protein DSM5745_06797 [Aspergillus mulundensis]RDW76805.1 hypothetical protein DSM5745_06797 [Aspergillus mulundensis]
MSTEPASGVAAATKVGRILADAQVGALLWGALPISLIADKYESDFPEISFVVLNHQIKVAETVLKACGYHLCRNPQCTMLEERAPGPVPTAHFHEQSFWISLLSKSDTLWWLPDWHHGPPAAQDPHLILTNDPRLPPAYNNGNVVGPTGPWLGFPGCLTLNPSAFTESILYLRVRDMLPPNRGSHPLEKVWRAMQYAMSDYGTPGQRPNTGPYRRTLRPEFQLAWDYLNGRRPDGHNISHGLCRLRGHLIDTGGLPSDSPNWNPRRYTKWEDIEVDYRRRGITDSPSVCIGPLR